MDKLNNIEKLNNKNYFSWKFKVKLILIKDDLWETITDEAPDSERPLVRWNKKDAKALSTIGLTVEDNQLVHIRNKNTAKEAWIALQTVHEKHTLTNRVSLYKKIALHRMSPGTKMEDHINEMDGYFQQLSDLGEDVNELWKVGMLFASLPKEYGTLITALEAREESQITWTLAYSKLIDEYLRQTSNDDEISEEKVLKINSNKLLCHFCKKSNHEMKDCFGFKRYQQFKEFETYQNEKKEREKRSANGKEVVNEIEEEDDQISYILCTTEGEEHHINVSTIERQDSNPKASTRTKSCIYNEVLNLKIDPVNMIKNINDLSKCFEELSKMGETMSDDFKLAILLNKLPEVFREYHSRITAQEEMNWKEVKGKIKRKVKENAKIKRRMKAEEKVFQTNLI